MTKENIALFKEELDEFHQLYADRPIANNEGGMKSPHLFATFHTLRKLRPLLIIESGVWKGQGTWLMKKALPEVNILSFDVDFGNLVYKHPEVNYVQNDIKNVPWDKMYEDNPKITPENTLLFLDDHQNFVERLVFLKNSPFKHIMFEDNYPSNQGDCLSPKKIKAGGSYVLDRNGDKSFHSVKPEEKMLFDSAVEEYIELPPIFSKDKTRWGDPWADYETPEAICEQIDDYPLFKTDSEIDSYTWICYMKLK